MLREKKATRPSSIVFSGDVGDSLIQALYRHPRLLIFNSGGGCVYDMLAAVDFLQKNPTTILVTGACFSAAMAVLLAGHRRLATPMARFLVHPGSVDLEAGRNLAGVELERGELAHLEKVYLDILETRTKRTRLWWAKKVRESHYFGVEEALRYGVIDDVT